MSADKIQPALTAEEWAKFTVVRNGRLLSARDGPDVGNGHGCITVISWEPGEQDERCDACGSDGTDEAFAEPEDRHALAALCLHGQPFGFTWDMVDHLRGDKRGVTVDEYDYIADRIAALLPPREDEP